MYINGNQHYGLDMDQLTKIHKRQLARFLDHLKRTGQYTPELEKDVKRSFGYVFEDVREAGQTQGNDKEQANELSKSFDH